MNRQFWLYTAWSIATAVIIISLTILLLYGMSFGPVKSSMWITAFLIALLHKIFIIDPIRISIVALWRAYRSKSAPPDYGFQKKLISPERQELRNIKQRLDYLMKKFQEGNWKPSDHKEERQSEKREKLLIHYDRVFYDLLMYTFYMVALLLIVLGSKSDLSYYSTRYVQDFFTAGRNEGPPTNQILTENELKSYLNNTIAKQLHDARFYQSRTIRYKPGFLDGRTVKVLGVARLRQQRIPEGSCSSVKSINHVNCSGYFQPSNQDTKNYSANWAPSVYFQYYPEYWRLLQPFTYQTAEDSDSLPLFGYEHYYHGGGYVAKLGRNHRNSQKVLNYLFKSNWIDNRTGVIFIEVNLYCVNANLFNLVTIVAARTPFGSFSMEVHVKTAKLLFMLSSLDWEVFIAFILFCIIIVLFIRRLVIRVAYKESFTDHGIWEYVDVVLIVFSIGTLALFFVRNNYVVSLLHYLEDNRKNTFVSFAYAAMFDDFFTVISGMLVCIATIRLWKILHFAVMFRVFSKTLYRSAGTVIFTLAILIVFMVSISAAVHVINGGSIARFSFFGKTLATVMTFSSGFVDLDVEEVRRSGTLVSFILYVVQAIVVNIFLINLLVTITLFYFSVLRGEMSERETKSYTFWQFIRDEYYEMKNNRSKPKRQQKDNKSLRLRGGGTYFSKSSQSTKNDQDSKGPEKVSVRSKYTAEKAGLANEIISTQMDYLERYISLRCAIPCDNEELQEESEIRSSETVSKVSKGPERSNENISPKHKLRVDLRKKASSANASDKKRRITKILNKDFTLNRPIRST